MDTDKLIQSWQARLVAIIDGEVVHYHATSKQAIARAYRRETRFEGYTEADIASYESMRGVRLTSVFRAYLLAMGKAQSRLFRGSDLAGPASFETFRQHASELLEGMGHPSHPPENAVIFLLHQGYQFEYQIADGSEDGPVMLWTEGEPSPTEYTSTFCECVEREIAGYEELVKEVNRDCGRHVQLNEDGQELWWSYSPPS